MSIPKLEQHPIVYELNTRLWLDDLSSSVGGATPPQFPSRESAAEPFTADTNWGGAVTLVNIPDDRFTGWTRLGFTHIWLMGVWECGPLLEPASIDTAPSPYAVTAYNACDAFGGAKALARFRERLHQHGLKLLLDFVPNHTSCIHPWVHSRPEYYVQSPQRCADCFRSGSRWIAHGKDPWFPAWIDTAQLDYRNTATRVAMIRELLAVAAQCDGVRCDMSMLLLHHVFTRTWKDFPSENPPPKTEFWSEATATVKQSHPDFLFLAEAYWDLEQQLLDLGFDYAYDKRIYDHITARNPRALSEHLRSKMPGFLARTTHFLENHDEPRIASLLDFEEHRAASFLTLALPGMRLLHEGQLTGATIRASVHRRHRPAEPTQHNIASWYQQLLFALKNSAIGRGAFELLQNTPDDIVALRWQADSRYFDLALINIASTPSDFTMPLPLGPWHFTDQLDARTMAATAESQLVISLPPHAARLFRFQSD